MEIQASLTLILIKTCLQYLKSLNDCPLLALTTCTDIFGMDLEKETDFILQCLQSNFNLMNAMEEAGKLAGMKFCSDTTYHREVIERQMYDYIEGSLSNSPTPMESQTLSAPAQNICLQRKL